ncbi:MAG: radical SAM protein [Bacteroidales bacterium]|nr:radical SAM protein [Bacteroidales bacterium]
MGKVHEKTFSLENKFIFPEKQTIHKIEEDILVIAEKNANWLVLNKIEYNMYLQFKAGKNISEVITYFTKKITKEDTMLNIQKFLIQIEDKQYYKDVQVNERDILRNATLYLTHECNLRCRHCYIEADKKNKNELTVVQWKYFLKEFKENGGKNIIFSGGEPVLYEGFYEIATYAKELSLKVILLTNGTIFSKDDFSKIEKLCDEVQVSIDGPNEKIHDYVRGKGTFKRSLKFIKYLGKRNLKLFVAMTPIPETLYEFYNDFEKFYSDLKNISNNKITVKITPKLLKGRNVNELNSNEDKKYKNVINKICDTYIEPNYFDKMDATALKPNWRRPSCGIGKSLGVFWDGSVKLCFDSDIEVGNICQDSLSQILDKLKAFYTSYRVEYTEPCKNCDIRYFCGGDCRISGIKNSGNMGKLICSEEFKQDFYHKLIRINKWLYNPILKQ